MRQAPRPTPIDAVSDPPPGPLRSAHAAVRFDTRYAAIPATPPSATGSSAPAAQPERDPTSTEVTTTPVAAVTSDQTRGRATEASRASRLPSHDLRDARSVLNRYSAKTCQMNAAPKAARAGRTSARCAENEPGAKTASSTELAGSVASPTATAAGGRSRRIASTPATIPSDRNSRRAGSAACRRCRPSARTSPRPSRSRGTRGRRRRAPRRGRGPARPPRRPRR